MARSVWRTGAAALALALVGGGVGAAPALGEPPADPGRDFGVSHRPVCPPSADAASCHALIVTAGSAPGASPLATTTYSNGYSPAQLRSAYNLTASGSGRRSTAPG